MGVRPWARTAYDFQVDEIIGFLEIGPSLTVPPGLPEILPAP